MERCLNSPQKAKNKWEKLTFIISKDDGCHFPREGLGRDSDFRFVGTFLRPDADSRHGDDIWSGRSPAILLPPKKTRKFLPVEASSRRLANFQDEFDGDRRVEGQQDSGNIQSVAEEADYQG